MGKTISLVSVLLIAVVAGVTALGFAPVRAEEAVSTPQQPNAACTNSQLTQEKFLDMVYAIAMHGDLTDVAFVEKTLQVKLTPEIIEGGAKEINPDLGRYFLPPILGAHMMADR